MCHTAFIRIEFIRIYMFFMGSSSFILHWHQTIDFFQWLNIVYWLRLKSAYNPLACGDSTVCLFKSISIGRHAQKRLILQHMGYESSQNSHNGSNDHCHHNSNGNNSNEHHFQCQHQERLMCLPKESWKDSCIYCFFIRINLSAREREKIEQGKKRSRAWCHDFLLVGWLFPYFSFSGESIGKCFDGLSGIRIRHFRITNKNTFENRYLSERKS